MKQLVEMIKEAFYFPVFGGHVIFKFLFCVWMNTGEKLVVIYCIPYLMIRTSTKEHVYVLDYANSRLVTPMRIRTTQIHHHNEDRFIEKKATLGDSC